MFNYTITFQQSADIFYPYGHTVKRPSPGKISGAHKTKLVFWIVSNCKPKKRMQYKKELEKYIPVDMIGACNKTYGDPCKRDYRCTLALKKQYKFYLAFENSLCQEYITEKFWKALNEGMVPIVMGAPRNAYERVAPPHSFIHVDDFSSPKELAAYLLDLNKNNSRYDEYHKWRETHAVQWNSANCDICRFAREKPQKVTDITRIWNAKEHCI
ncbi:4-galactosyl-N-acetylglucosaminide 3-alpha-L-fucosyltransferase FUT6-like [Watersipora subatra]|uniref:4-galactosyl-N-acetylglucosaminide 3-alpha-L-fucosyltransferase FUT6-like n=1 Tax=Watersipora subatra TaxID=2589382 RepID=UPI00355BAACC